MTEERTKTVKLWTINQNNTLKDAIYQTYHAFCDFMLLLYCYDIKCLNKIKAP